MFRRLSIFVNIMCNVPIVVVFVFLANASTRCQAAPPVRWLVGPQFRRQMESPLGIIWSSKPLRDALLSLSLSQRVAIILDRRIDPGQKIQFSVDDVPLEEALRQFARQHDLGVSLVGNVVYLGPPAVAEKLLTLTAVKKESSRQLPAAVRRRLARRQPSHWDDLAVPREVINRLTRENGLKLEGDELIPHDLWPEADLPPMGLIERLTLILAGFDLTFEFVGQSTTVRLVPIPAKVSLRRVYSVGLRGEQWVATMAKRFPGAQIQVTDEGFEVAARLEDHRAISRFLQGKPPRRSHRVKTGRKVYTLEIVDKPVGPLIKALARDINKQVSFDPRVRGQLDQLVTFRVRNVSLDDLLNTALRQVGLSYTLEDNTIQVKPADKPQLPPSGQN